MKKILLISFMSVLSIFAAKAGHFVTPGNGTHYTMALLAATEGSGVDYSTTAMGDVFTINDSITISAGDSLTIDGDVAMILLKDKVLIAILGYGEIVSDGQTIAILPYGREDNPYNIVFGNPDQRVQIRNVEFITVGVTDRGTQGMDLEKVGFYSHNGSNGTKAALQLGPSGASYTVKNCVFTDGQSCAIAGAANYSTPVVIESCRFERNVKLNRNTPQVNLTAADSIVIRNCSVYGDSTLSKVGGIAVSNFISYPNALLLIENCEVKDHRYGITTSGAVYSVIRNNIIVNNKFDPNPMTGGSGISLYDSSQKATSMISGNQIEGNLWGITVIGCASVNIGRIDVDPSARDYNPGGNTFMGNGNSGELYDVYNNSANTVYAQNNTWGVTVQDSVSIEGVVFHKNDDPSLGEVIFMPCAVTNAISTATASSEKPASAAIYNLQGIRQKSTDLQQLPKGIYIRSGKKVVRK